MLVWVTPLVEALHEPIWKAVVFHGFLFPTISLNQSWLQCKVWVSLREPNEDARQRSSGEPSRCHQAAAPAAARCSLGWEQGPAGKSLKQSAVSCGQTGALSSKLPQVSVSREETSSVTGSSPSPDLPPEGCRAAAVPTPVWGRSPVGWAPLVQLKPASLAIGVGRQWLGSLSLQDSMWNEFMFSARLGSRLQELGDVL